MRVLTSALVTEKNRLASESAWLTLLEVEITSSVVLYLVAHPQAVTFDGRTYNPFPFSVEPVQTDTKGGLAEVVVNVANVDRSVGAYVEQNDLRGNRVRMLVVHSANLADPNAITIDEIYEISDIEVTEQAVTFRLGHERLLSQRLPGGRYLRDNCRWVYKSPIDDVGGGCGYAGGLASCDKVLEGGNGCRAHGNQARFGAFPGLPSVKGRLVG